MQHFSRWARAACAVLGLLALSACGPKPGEDEAMRAVFDQVRDGRIEEVVRQLPEPMRTDNARVTIASLRALYIPETAPTRVRRIQWRWSQVGDARTATAVHEYTYPDRVLYVTTTLQTSATLPPVVETFRINAFDPAQAKPAAFTVTGKPPRHLLFLAGFAASIGVMTFALLGVLFTRSFRRKWLWAIVALAGAPVFVMNWETGASQMIAAIGLINAGIGRGLFPLDPWIVRFQFPFGALITLSFLVPHWFSRRTKH